MPALRGGILGLVGRVASRRLLAGRPEDRPVSVGEGFLEVGDLELQRNGILALGASKLLGKLLESGVQA